MRLSGTSVSPLLFEADNRGNKLAPVFFNDGVAGGVFNDGVAGGVAERNDLTSPGDGCLMRQWFGREMDVRRGSYDSYRRRASTIRSPYSASR